VILIHLGNIIVTYLPFQAKKEVSAISLAGGYETNLTNSLTSFFGLNSVLSFTKDTIYNITEKIFRTDTATQIDSVQSFQIIKIKQVALAIPIGLEYQITKPFVIRTGISPKLTYERWEIKDEKQVYPISDGITISFKSSLGLGFRLTKNLSVDLYNGGELFTSSEWLVQGRYRL
jgi:opacity protein-like surface antigen